MKMILVWDMPVRVGHWLLVGAFAIAWLTGESEEWRLVHAYAGGTVVGVTLFRLIWGVVGTRHARFASFVRGSSDVIAYLGGLLRGINTHSTGHNAAGGWAILALLALALLSGATGWFAYQDILGDWLGELHEGITATMLAVVCIHIAGVAAGSIAHRENLVRSMVTGLKLGRPDEAILGARPLAAVVLLTWVAACAWWLAR